MRYLLLVLLNTPIVLLALVNIITQYKIRRISVNRFRQQLVLWLAILIVLLGSFPMYNHLTHRSLFDSSELSSFDITQTTVLIYLIYIVNNQRRKIEQNERFLRDLHQELAIKLSSEPKRRGKS